jgi:D-alanyl-D-alanine carboxypeptidase
VGTCLPCSGKIALTDPLGKYLTGYPNKDVASKVTIHHLLTHTGGTGDTFGPQFDAHRLELRALNAYVKLYGERGLKFEPGSRWEYSNYGFLLLGVVIENVTGGSYYDYVRDRVFKPAGMTSTASLPEDEVVPGRSIGYVASRGPNTDTLPYRGTSAGGGYSTAEDLVRFAGALESHKLLNAQYTSLLTTGKVDAGGEGKYAEASSTGTGRHPLLRAWWRRSCGMNGDLQIFPQSGYAIAALSNLDPPSAQRAASFIALRLPAK